VLDFLDGKFRLSKSLSAPWAGKTVENLTPTEQRRLASYSFSAEVFRGISDLEVIEIFARLNTYSVPLNAQELRNGKYFGFFKQSAYGLAHAHLEFWRRHGIFSERNLARMLEVELTSELLIAQTAGMQDKKKSIDDFYEKYDDSFPARRRIEKRFEEVIDVVNETFEDTLWESEFSRPPLFYTLFCTIYHRIFRLPNMRLRTPARRLTKAERLSLSEAADDLSEIIALGRTHESVPRRYTSFVAACLRQTDNIKPRQERLRFLYDRAF
jgi:hypothetical protein